MPGPKKVRAEISLDQCAGVAMCMQFAPGAFHRNETGQAVFDATGRWTEEELQEAADACPMSAITIVDV
nr:ferredoxin [Rhodoligotrophos appendicifer]